MKLFFKIIAYIVAIIVAFVLLVVGYMSYMHEPNWHVEMNAVKSESHPLAGFWKGENCDDDWGWAIGPAGEGLYYISFCGPGGCFAEDTYRDNITIINDPKYNVVSEDTIKFLSQEGWTTHIRCPGRT